MPKDKSGKYHPNIQLAHAADGMAAKKPMGGMPSDHGAKEGPMDDHEQDGDGEHTELHDHGDGSFHTMMHGERTEHPHIGHALMHMAHAHMPDHEHEHHMSDGMEKTVHKVSHDGNVEGPSYDGRRAR